MVDLEESELDFDDPASAFPLALGSLSIPGCCNLVGLFAPLAGVDLGPRGEGRSDSNGLREGGRGMGDGTRSIVEGPSSAEGTGD
jgi:hypothetical protein